MKDVDVKSPYKEYLAADPFLLEYGGVAICELPDGRKLLLSVSYTTIKDNSGADRLRRIKVCQSKARSNVVKETEGIRVTTYSKLTDKVTVRIENGRETATSLETLLEVNEERSRGIVKGMKTVGTWRSGDDSMYYLAMASISPSE